MKKALFLFNPHAGKGRIASKVARIADTLTKADFLVTAYPTQSKGDAFNRILAWGEEYDRIIIAGGDGMLHEAINGIMRLDRKPDLGYIPTGTVNDFAKSNRIPKDIDAAAVLAAGESRHTIDVGLFNDEYFSYVAAFGAITDVPYTTDQNAKNSLGFMAYVFNAIRYVDPKILAASCRQMEITTDEYSFSGEFLVACVSNSRTIGSFKQLVPRDADLKDGLMEGLLIRKPANFIELGHTLELVISGKLKSEDIITVKSSVFEFRTEQNTPWTLDGEDGGIHRNVEIKDCRESLTMLLP